jgi:predicted nucleotidyltransferase
MSLAKAHFFFRQKSSNLVGMINKPLNKQIIYAELQRHKAILEQYGVSRIGLFGSFVRDEGTDKSDIDFLVDFENGKKTLSNLVNLGDFLENLFNKKVDIVTPQGLSPFIGPYILKEVEYAKVAS